jgi:ATP-dependent exoDNAse (exonuclease V) alpha subunit
MQSMDFYRWLYTAVTRATDKVYLLQFQDNFFARPDNISGD